MTGLLGAPVLSDALALGNIFEWWKMDEDSKLALITGFRDYADVSNDRKTYELIRILNTSLGRQVYQTMPLLLNGKLGAAMQFEAGLYPTSKAKEYKKKAINKVNDLMPQDLENAIKYLQEEASEHAKKAKTNPFPT